jgi:hypothetical protein
MSQINIERHQSFSHSGCNFTTYDESQFLMVAEYWEASQERSNKLPLQGFGRATYRNCVEACIEAIEQAVNAEFSLNHAIGKETLLIVPVVVMRFTLHPRKSTAGLPRAEKDELHQRQTAHRTNNNTNGEEK